MISFFLRKTKRERYQEWRARRRVERARRFKAARDRLYWARFLAYVGHYKKTILGIFILTVFGGGIGLVLPYVARFVLDHVVPKRNFHLLNQTILAAAAVMLAYALLRYLEQRLVVTFSMNLITEIRRDLFNHQMKLPLSYYEKHSPGKLISKLTYSIYTVKLLVETFAYVCLRETVLIGMVVIAAFCIEWRLTLLFLGLLPLVVLYIRRLNRYMAEVAVRLQTKNDQILRLLDRAFHSAKLLQIFGTGSRETDSFSAVLDQDKAHRIRRTMVYNTNAILIALLSSCLLLAALWYGGRQIILGRLSHGELLAYLFCLAMLFRPVSEFVRATAYLQAGKIGIRTIFSVFENTTPIEEPARPVTPAHREGRIEFRNVWFRYGTGNGGLKNATFAVEPGQRVLIVGRSGAGKSTIFNLLMRLYDCDRGSIFIDGVNARSMRLETLRNYFSVVTQDRLHLEDTVLNNVLFGSEAFHAGDHESQLERALEIGRRTGMNRFITFLDKKYGQRIDSEGSRFSRGELQKLALMRALSKDAPIILMDEPTSSLDHHSEREALRLINGEFTGKTTLIVSHRPLPSLKADWILVLRQGRVEAQGNHHTLKEHCKYYRQLSSLPSAPDEQTGSFL